MQPTRRGFALTTIQLTAIESTAALAMRNSVISRVRKD
jgi:hypothetical protein